MFFLYIFFSLFIFRGHSTREPATSRVTYLILHVYTGTGVSHSQHRKKIGRGFRKNAGEWTGRVEINKEEIPGSKRSMYVIYWSTPGFKGRTFKLCVLTRSDFNFCVRSSPMRGHAETLVSFRQEQIKQRLHKVFESIVQKMRNQIDWVWYLTPRPVNRKRSHQDETSRQNHKPTPGYGSGHNSLNSKHDQV